MKWLALTTVLAAAPALAAEPVITEPDWKRKPDAYTLWRVMPTKAAETGTPGKAVLVCRVNIEGALYDCAVDGEEPVGMGFAQAALSLAPMFEMSPKMVDGKPVVGEVRVPLTWKITAPIRRTTGAKVLRSVAWLSAPTAEQVLKTYPKGPREKGEAGRVILMCRYRDNGDVNRCAIRDMTDGGFGGAALSLVSLFKGPPLSAEMKGGEYKIQIVVTYAAESLRGEARRGRAQWVTLPTEADIAAAYPPQALKDGVGGSVSVGCRIGARGDVADCQANAESPASMGFGAAAVAVAQAKARATIWTDEGLPTMGDPVQLSIAFRPAQARLHGAAK